MEMKKKIDGKQYGDPPYSTDERLALYEDYKEYIKSNKYRDAWGKRIECSLEQFLEACKLEAKWDTFAITFEKLINRPFNLDDFKKWYNKASPHWKKLQAAYGNRVCEAYGCIAILPKDSNPLKKYHSKKCQEREKNRNRDKAKKATSNVQYYGKKFIKQEGITENEFKAAITVMRDYKSNRGTLKDVNTI